MSLQCDVLAENYHWTEPVAGKALRCCECSAPIRKGEKHFRCTGMWDGQPFTRRQHLLCMEACMLIRDKLNGGECVSFGGLQEGFRELTQEWYDRKEDRDKPVWKQIRSLMAAILRRQRAGSNRPTT